ncbi:hypothetical protein G6F31_013471 [Rhizopus arrhizus]|nr:hypothetical protein G6F31_013471 [Rhizopus arrhizus]
MGNGMRGFGLVGLALLAGCGQAPPTALGTLEWDRVTVPAPSAEVIAAVEVREGQQVKAGQLLYQVDPAPYQAAFDTARGQLAQAEASVLSAQPKAERTRALVSMDAASKQDADDATSALKQAQANVIAARAALQAARINLDYTRVTAPIDGRIGTSSVTAGALVAAGQDAALTTIQRLDPVYLDVTQSSTQMLALRKQLDAGLVKAIDGKAQVQVVLEDGSTYAHEGTLEFVGSAVDPGTGNVVLRAVIPNPDGLLLPGMYLKAVLPMATDARALLVQQKAVERNERGEPLLRKHIENLVGQLAQLRTPDGRPLDLTLTTNGSVLARKAAALKAAGLTRVTVSLDALDAAMFQDMSDSGFTPDDVLHGINAAASAGLAPVKVNMVVRRGLNDGQILPMAERFRHSGHILRFIDGAQPGSAGPHRRRASAGTGAKR